MTIVTDRRVCIAGWILASLVLNACVPLLDAVNLAYALKRNRTFYHGRFVASCAYLSGSLTLGFIAAHTAIQHALSLWLSVFAFLAAVCLPNTPHPIAGYHRPINRMVEPGFPDASISIDVAGPQDRAIPAFQTILPWTVIALIVAAGSLIEASHGVNTFVMLQWTHRGYDPWLCSILWQVGECSDIALMWFLCRISSNPWYLLIISGAAAAIRWAGFALAPPIGVVALLQTLHALSFTGTYVAAIQLLDRMVPQGWRLACQLMAWAIFLYLSKAVVMLFCGEYLQGDPGSSFRLMSLLGLCGTGCAVVALLITRWSMSFKFHST